MRRGIFAGLAMPCGIAGLVVLAALVVVVATALVLTATPARADTPTDMRAELERDAARTDLGPRERAEAILRLAELDDDAFAFARALARYDEGRALDPGSPRAPRAEARAAALRAHAEGDFAPFAKLERVRRDPALASDARTIDELVHDADGFPAGPVRVEVWVLAAEAYAHRLGRPGDADRLLARVIVDARADHVLAQKAARDLVTLRMGAGDLAGAEDAARLAGSHADPQLMKDVRRTTRRRQLHYASIALLAAMAGLAARAWLSASRRGGPTRVRRAIAKTWKIAIAYAAYVAGGGALLASGYEVGTSRPFLYFGVVLVPVVLVARAWGAAGGDGAWARAGRAVVCGGAAMAAALLVLEAVDVAFLEGMGL